MTIHNLQVAMDAEGIGPLAKLTLIWIAATSGKSGVVDLNSRDRLQEFMGCEAEDVDAVVQELVNSGYILPRDDQGRWMLTPNEFEIS